MERTITEGDRPTDLVVNRESSEDSITKRLESLEVVTVEPIGSDTGEDDGDEPSMDRMLEELMSTNCVNYILTGALSFCCVVTSPPPL